MDNSLVVQLGMDLHKMEQGLHHGSELLEGFKEQVEELGKGFLAAFAVEKVADFAFEVSELAAKAHGVKDAFSQLPQSNALMEQLRETTHETVGDLELMGYAVHAQNLKIPLTDLGELLEFAHIRALATNKDFNELANTLLTGIGKGGKGAKKAMAELQVSTEDYNKALKETGTGIGAVMKIASEAIENNKGKMDETLQSIEANSAAWENFKIALGEALNKSNLLSGGLKTLNASLKIVSSENLDFWEKLEAFSSPYAMMNALLADNYDTQRKISSEAHDQVAAFKAAYDKLHPQVEDVKNIAFYENEIKELQEKINVSTGQELTNNERDLEINQQKLEVLKLQYATQRDMANTATIKKMSGFNNNTSPQLANTSLLPPSENIDKANKAIQTTIDLLHKQVKASDEAAYSMYQIFQEEKIKRFTDTLKEGMVRIVSTLAEGLGEMASGAASSDEVFAMVLQSAAGMLRQLGELAISAGITAIALENLLDNPYTAIAAGIALVALSGAVSGAAKNIVSGHGGGGASPAHVSSASSSYGRTDNSTQMYGSVKISGQDLWVVLSNYKTNSNFTRIG